MHRDWTRLSGSLGLLGKAAYATVAYRSQVLLALCASFALPLLSRSGVGPWVRLGLAVAMLTNPRNQVLTSFESKPSPHRGKE